MPIKPSEVPEIQAKRVWDAVKRACEYIDEQIIMKSATTYAGGSVTGVEVCVDVAKMRRESTGDAVGDVHWPTVFSLVKTEYTSAGWDIKWNSSQRDGDFLRMTGSHLDIGG